MASSETSRSSHARLVAWIRSHPGRAANALLATMADRVGRDGELAERGHSRAAPAVAKSYFFRFLRINLPTAGARTRRELLTLCSALDLLAQGRPATCADVIAQRIKAVERATLDGDWQRAEFLEIIEPETGALTNKDEELLVAREAELRARLAQIGPPRVVTGGWSSSGSAWPALGGGPRSKGHGKDRFPQGQGGKGQKRRGKGDQKGKGEPRNKPDGQ